MLRQLSASLIAMGVAASLSAQSPCFDLALGTDLALADDSTSAAQNLGFTFTYNGVGYTQIRVCSNGYIWLGAANAGADWSPTEAELLAQGPRICPMWMDFNPSAAGSGHVYFDNATPGLARITWAGVFTFGTTTPTDMQVTLDLTNSITVTIGQLGPSSTAQGGTSIVGSSGGGAALANPISLATRPVITASDTAYEVILNAAGTSAPYANTKMMWTPTLPGWVVTDISCTPGQLPPPASSQIVGEGCPSRSGPSLYELFTPTNAADLNGFDLSLLPSGGSDYLAIPGISPLWFAGFTNNLALADDAAVAVTLPFPFPFNGGTESTIHVSSNGFLTIGATNPGSGCCTPNVATMLAGAPRVSGWWEDLNPAAGGAVYADLDAVSGDFVVTWNGVVEYGTTNPNTFQIALSPSGMITTRWVTLTPGAGTYLAGYSRGGGTPDTGSADLSAVNGRTISATVRSPLTLAAAAASRPAIGSTFTVEAGGVQPLPNGVFCILLISLEVPGGIPLDGLGLTGCTAYIALPELLSYFNLTLGAATTTFPIAIPLDPAFSGVQLMSQAISDDLGANAFGYRVSNGLRWNIGL
ncbi:MAG: hypothetical protein ABL997_00785 [Planctomycetota bacterium]